MIRFLSEKLNASGVKGRRARFESLELRLLLDVGRGIAASELETIVAEYPGFDYAEIAPEKVLTLDATNGIGVDALRQAFDAAQKNDGADLIVVKTSDKSDPTITFSKASNSLTINDPSPVTLVVVGSQKLTIDGASKARLLTVSERSNVGIGGVVFTGGASSAGGAIYNSGALTLDRVWITGNLSTGKGGGVYNESTLTVVNSVISGNRASEHGGGVYSTGSYSKGANEKTQTFVNDTITGNVAGYESEFGLGGGIYFQGVDADYNIFANARLYNSIVVQNRSSATLCDVNIYNSLFYNEIDAFDEHWTFEEATPGLIDGDYNLTSFIYWESYYDVDDEQDVGTNQIYNASIPLFNADYDFDANAEGDYALYEIEASQAIDQGGRSAATYPGGKALTRDFSGKYRVQNGAPDVGAYETYSEKNDLEISEFMVASISAAPIGAVLQLDGIVVTNVGSFSSKTTTVRFYASKDATLDATDVVLGEKTLGVLAAQESRVVVSGELSSASLESGAKYYFFCRVDADSEGDESNNTCRTLDSVYFFEENAYDLEDWSFRQETCEVSQGCAFFAEVVAGVNSETHEKLSFWFDYGDGVFQQGKRFSWVFPSQYEGTAGTYTITVKVVDDDSGKVVGKASSKLTVKKTVPNIKVDARTLGDGAVLSLRLNVFSANGLPVKKWEISWGDGSTSTFDSLGDSLTSAHRYASQTNDASYSVTLKLYDAETKEGISYTIGAFGVSGSSKSNAAKESSRSTSGIFGSTLPSKYAFVGVDKVKNVFEELCERNWIDE